MKLFFNIIAMLSEIGIVFLVYKHTQNVMVTLAFAYVIMICRINTSTIVAHTKGLSYILSILSKLTGVKNKN